MSDAALVSITTLNPLQRIELETNTVENMVDLLMGLPEPEISGCEVKQLETGEFLVTLCGLDVDAKGQGWGPLQAFAGALVKLWEDQ